MCFGDLDGCGVLGSSVGFSCVRWCSASLEVGGMVIDTLVSGFWRKVWLFVIRVFLCFGSWCVVVVGYVVGNRWVLGGGLRGFVVMRMVMF